jgi:hypothetical protein
MAINKNHEFEELNGIKCAIVEKNATAERVAFLKPLLEFNKYTVVVVASPPPKAAPAPKAVPATDKGTQPITVGAQPPPQPELESQPQQPPPPETFTIGVADVTFNPTNAIFGRLLKTPDGHVVTLAYWQQKEFKSHDEVPYYEA